MRNIESRCCKELIPISEDNNDRDSLENSYFVLDNEFVCLIAGCSLTTCNFKVGRRWFPCEEVLMVRVRDYMSRCSVEETS